MERKYIVNKNYTLKKDTFLCVGNKHTSLVYLDKKFEISIPSRYLYILQEAILGKKINDNDPNVQELVQKKILVEESPNHKNTILYQRLKNLDDRFTYTYFHHLSQREKQAYEMLLKAHSYRKYFFEAVGQCPILPETALRRALFIGDSQKTKPLKILCLGDDDLVSIALASLGHKVLVYDIDDYLLHFLSTLKKELGLDIDVVEYDMRDPIPQNAPSDHDIFMMDPMSNRECFELFLSRAFSLLRKDGTGYVAVYAPVLKLFKTIASEMNFDTLDIALRFNRYYTKCFNMHEYESDWVKVKKRHDTKSVTEKNAFSTSADLYREDYFHRQKTICTYINTIEQHPKVSPLFLSMFFDHLQKLVSTPLKNRYIIYEKKWVLFHILLQKGYLNLHIDHENKTITFDLLPFEENLVYQLNFLLFRIYKIKPSQNQIGITKNFSDIRVYS